MISRNIQDILPISSYLRASFASFGGFGMFSGGRTMKHLLIPRIITKLS